MKIGIMGGTFNPIHFGHLFLAENAYEQAGLDKVLFMPSKNPPHKPFPEGVNQQQRVEMISLAIANNPHFELSTIELSRDGLTYTADTLQLLSTQNPDNEYFFIVGTDSLFYMQHWKDPQIVFDHCTVLVAGRDNADMDSIQKHMELLQQSFQAKIIYVEMPTIQISSADIRTRIKQEKTVHYYLPEPIIDYVEQNRLYKE